MEEHTCLIRENSSNLLLANGVREKSHQGQSSGKDVTTLGPGNMALATPAQANDQEKSRTRRKRSSEEMERPEEQVIGIGKVFNYPVSRGPLIFQTQMQSSPFAQTEQRPFVLSRAPIYNRFV